MDELRVSIEQANNILQGEIDICERGILSVFNRESQDMAINCDYYNQSSSIKVYHENDEINDLFSSFHRHLYHMLPAAESILQYRMPYAMLWAELGKAIPPYSILHIEHFYGAVPCTGFLDKKPNYPEAFDYFMAEQVKRAMGNRTIEECPAVLLRDFGAVIVGHKPADLLKLARILEIVAKNAWEIYSKYGDRRPYIRYSVMNHFHALYNNTESSYMQMYNSDESVIDYYEQPYIPEELPDDEKIASGVEDDE